MEMARSGNELAQKHCQPCKGGGQKLTAAQARRLLEHVKGWEIVRGEVVRTFKFKNFHQTMSFVNAIAFIANRENHHPDLEVGYDACKVRFSTHSSSGLTENDSLRRGLTP